MNCDFHKADNNIYCKAELQPTVIYLNNAIDVKAHDKLGDITHQIVEPVVDTCQNVDWFVVVPEKHSNKVRG